MNYLDNGTVLPSGLLGQAVENISAFNKTYKNFPLRFGIVVDSYPVGDQKNHTGLTTEYDVMVFEQQEDQGSSVVKYKNCLSADGLGSIADFFEKTIRKQTRKPSDGSQNTKDQDGSVVLLLCLDGVSEKAIILGAITHPDRKTTLKDGDPHLEGEYNGIHVVVNKDGSTTLTFKGATDNDGKIKDNSQGPTELRIEKDGSYQVKHKTITQRFDKGGKASLTADDDISNTTKKNFNVSADENIVLKATKNFNLSCAELVASASGSASLECQKLSVQAQSEINFQGSQLKVQAEAMVNIKAPTIVLDGMVSLGGQGGQPVLLLSTMMQGTGNLGIPVISTAISGYATKVMAT